MVNNLKIIQENSNNVYPPNTRINLDPLPMNIARNDYLNKIMNCNQENSQKISEDVNRINNKLFLKPIDIKDKKTNVNYNGHTSLNNVNKNHETNNKNNLNLKNNQKGNENGSGNNKNIYPKVIKNKNIVTNSNNLNKEHPKISNHHSTSQLITSQINNTILEAKNYLSSKNLISESNFIINPNENLSVYNELLKREKIKEALNKKLNKQNFNSTTLDENSHSPENEKKLVDKFSKTSNFEFNIIENLDVINLNTDISLIEENLKLNKGEIMKRLKSIYDNFNISQHLFRNNSNINLHNKSLYQNTSMFDKNPNITRIETIFEDYEVKFDEMILISSHKSTRKLGNLKKMLHAASLNLFVVRVQ